MGALKIKKSGYTLIEVLVAGILILITVTATAGVLRHGQKVHALEQQRNRARQLLVTELEKQIYAHSQFDSLPSQTVVDSLVLDDRGTASESDDLKAMTLLTVDSAMATVAGYTVPRKRIAVQATWSSLDGTDTLTLEKWICKVLL